MGFKINIGQNLSSARNNDVDNDSDEENQISSLDVDNPYWKVCPKCNMRFHSRGYKYHLSLHRDDPIDGHFKCLFLG